jgi:regulatory protein
MRRRLRRDFPEAQAEAVVVQLRSKGLLNDVAFARQWRESREKHKPRSGRMIGQELRKAGVPREVTREALEGLDEEGLALRAGRKQMRKLARESERNFIQKMGQFLLRKGFGYGVALRAARQLWLESADAHNGHIDG